MKDITRLSNVTHATLSSTTRQAGGQWRQVVSLLALAGIFSLGSGLSLMKPAMAAPDPISVAPSTVSLDRGAVAANLPGGLVNAVLKDVMMRSQLPSANLQIVEAEARIWRDDCLGLPSEQPGCPAVLVSGWKITVESGQQRWVYRTDRTGSQIGFDEMKSVVRDGL